MHGLTTGSLACRNCGAALSGPFCAACGQKDAPPDPTVHDFLHEFSHEMLHVDGRIFRSVWKLLAAPGFLTREQFEGRRARWISPIRLYLIFSLAYFAFAALAAPPVVFRADEDPEAAAFLRRIGFDSPVALREAVNDARTHWGPRAMFVLVPVFAWLAGRAARRSRRHYPQHLYFALHVHAAWFAVAALVALAGLIVPAAVEDTLELIPVVYGFVYVALAFRTAYGTSVTQSLVRTAAVVFAYYVVVGLVAVGIALAVIFGHGSAALTAVRTSAAITCLSRDASSRTHPDLAACRT